MTLLLITFTTLSEIVWGVLSRPVMSLCWLCVGLCCLCVGSVLACVGCVLALCWLCVGSVLALCWPCVGSVLALCWPVLALCWPCVGCVLSLCWPCVCPVAWLGNRPWVYALKHSLPSTRDALFWKRSSPVHAKHLLLLGGGVRNNSEPKNNVKNA